ncbi:hypothetical protein V8C86DRAFT_1133429 [Haematococcus lacustris]
MCKAPARTMDNIGPATSHGTLHGIAQTPIPPPTTAPTSSSQCWSRCFAAGQDRARPASLAPTLHHQLSRLQASWLKPSWQAGRCNLMHVRAVSHFRQYGLHGLPAAWRPPHSSKPSLIERQGSQPKPCEQAVHCKRSLLPITTTLNNPRCAKGAVSGYGGRGTLDRRVARALVPARARGAAQGPASPLTPVVMPAAAPIKHSLGQAADMLPGSLNAPRASHSYHP